MLGVATPSSELNMFSSKIQFNSYSSKRTANCYSKHAAMEKDSGVYDNYSVSRRGSACSSVGNSVYSRNANSPDTTASSAYSSVTSSCSGNELQKRMQPMPNNFGENLNQMYVDRVPYHPQLAAFHQSATSSCQAESARPSVSCRSQLLERGFSSSSVKSEQDVLRCLYDPINNKTYEKKRLLGKGGFARVYEVAELDSQTGMNLTSSTLAAKLINKSRISRSIQREKVEIEIELLAEACGHPNVLGFVDCFENENYVCILLELCRKKSLAQYLRRHQYLSEPEVCDIMQQVVSGLSHLHDRGIIHRDLKLGNILLTDDMQAKIGDFGLATRVAWGRKRTICGTPNFIAPEVLQRQGHGTESDIWALGCLLYTLLVGKPPFETGCLKDTYKCILKNSYRIPATVSAEAADLIRCMLRHKPKSRPTISEVATHQFFKKHADYLASIHRPVINNSMTSVKDCDVKPSDVEACLSSEDKSLTQVGSDNIEKSTTLDKLCQDYSQTKCDLSSEASKHTFKSLACRLQKKLSKMSSPKKSSCSSIATDDTPTLSNTSKRGISSPKAKALIGKTDTNQNIHVSSTSCVPLQPSPTWVTKWVDYSNRYGFGYQLVSGRICVLFNDGKHISINPSERIIEYSAREDTKLLRFAVDTVPPCLVKHVDILMNFVSYMDKNLSNRHNDECFEKVNDEARLLTWCRTDQYVAMYFNDGMMQLNFTADHVKIGVSSLHTKSAMRFTVVNEQRQFSHFTREQFLSQADAQLRRRMMVVHQQFHDFFDVQCQNHPFCCLCVQL